MNAALCAWPARRFCRSAAMNRRSFTAANEALKCCHLWPRLLEVVSLPCHEMLLAAMQCASASGSCEKDAVMPCLGVAAGIKFSDRGSRRMWSASPVFGLRSRSEERTQLPLSAGWEARVNLEAFEGSHSSSFASREARAYHETLESGRFARPSLRSRTPYMMQAPLVG